jgi:hypothetical protein
MEDLAKTVTGHDKPKSFIIDSSILEGVEEFETIKEEIKQNRVIFEFPEGLNDIDLIDRCRMLFSTDNFDLCYETVVAMLEGKPVRVFLKNYDNKTTMLFAEFQVTHKEMDLKGIPVLNEYPIIVNWLVEFIVGLELKKCPLPLTPSLVAEAETEERRNKKKKQKQKQQMTQR